MAAPEKFRLQIVTPKGVVFADDVEEVVAPSVDGEFGILPGRLPMLAALTIGLLHYRKPGEAELTDVAVGQGFVEVSVDQTLVLTDRFMGKAGIDVLALRQKLKEIDESLENWSGELDAPARLELIEEEQWLAAQLEVYGDPAVPRVLEFRRANDYAMLLPTLSEGEELELAKALAVDPLDDADPRETDE